MSAFLTWLMWGAVVLTMASGVPVRVVAEVHIPIGPSSTMPKECYPKGLYLYETETAGPDGCGVLVGGSGPWRWGRAADERAEANGSSSGLPADPGSGSEGQALGASAQTAPEASAGSGGPAMGTGRRLLVDQVAQLMRVYENGAETRTLPVSTGMLTSKTFTRAWQGTVGQDMGAVSVDGGMRAAQAWYLFPDVFGNILIHSVPYIRQGSARVYDQPEALGVQPTSHGCIRISEEDADWLRAWDPVGVPIEITGPPGPVRHVG